MKIGIDVRPLRDTMTGIGRYITQMLHALAARDDQNEYTLFYNNFFKGGIPQTVPNAGNFRLTAFRWPRKLLTALWGFTEFPKVESFIGDIDLFHSPSFQVPPSKNAARIFTIYDLIALTHPQLAIPSAVRHFTPRIRHYAKRADLIVAISQATARDVIKYLNVPDEKVVTVYPGTTSLIRADDEKIHDLKKIFGIENDYFLYVSRLDPRKNLTRLFLAFERSGLSKDFEFVVAGPEGWHMEEMLRTWDTVKCKNRIRRVDYVKDEDLAALYSGATFFVYPSLVEGFGLPILEAMSVGCPVLTSDVSSMPEVAGDAVLYCDPYDIESISEGLLRLASDSELRKNLSEAGSERIKLFTWEKMADNMIGIYNQVYESFRKR